jgi:hypothetical protein
MVSTLQERAKMNKFGAGRPISNEWDLASYQVFLCERVIWLQTCEAELQEWHESSSSRKVNIPEGW